MTPLKRTIEEDLSSSNSHKKITSSKGHSYRGYKINGNQEKLDQLHIDNLDKQEFQQKYVSKHRPCVIKGVIPELDLSAFDLGNLKETLDYGDDLVQVEKKVNGGFGSGAERLKMTLGEFLAKLRDPNEDDLYLTTQYEEDDAPEGHVTDSDEEDEDEENEKGFLEDFSKEANDDDEDDDSIDLDNLHDDFVDSETEFQEEDDEQEADYSVLQPPLTNLYDKIPLQPSIIDDSVTQQINLWVGSTKLSQKEEKDSLEVGRRLPAKTKGTSSGLHHDHSDNLYIPIKGRKRFTLYSPYDVDSLYTVGDVCKVYENGVIDYEINENAPNWKHVASDGSIIESEETAERPKVDPEQKLDPPSFSKIPPFYIHLDDVQDAELREKLQAQFETRFPRLTKLHSIQVELSPGEMLFLPCGWFHEVTSFGNEDNCHILLNYWFVPAVGPESGE